MWPYVDFHNFSQGYHYNRTSKYNFFFSKNRMNLPSGIYYCFFFWLTQIARDQSHVLCLRVCTQPNKRNTMKQKKIERSLRFKKIVENTKEGICCIFSTVRPVFKLFKYIFIWQFSIYKAMTTWIFCNQFFFSYITTYIHIFGLISVPLWNIPPI